MNEEKQMCVPDEDKGKCQVLPHLDLTLDDLLKVLKREFPLMSSSEFRFFTASDIVKAAFSIEGNSRVRELLMEYVKRNLRGDCLACDQDGEDAEENL